METHFENIEREHEAISKDRVVGDLKTLARDAEELLKATAGEMGEKMSEKAKQARSRLAIALEQAKVSCARWEDKTVAAARATDKAIRSHPYESAGAAFVMGVLIGVLIGRK
ncbi:MAG: DUF883 domain-containing protein [Verrucomicrobia bacterium]|jgi:ElaB/YqjD/DUF883 family membrane-anchored ribosome-binding protein|nr:DUF883 domain-containing protein [Verrucomicrobiota bacterium]